MLLDSLRRVRRFLVIEPSASKIVRQPGMFGENFDACSPFGQPSLRLEQLLRDGKMHAQSGCAQRRAQALACQLEVGPRLQ